MPKLAIQVASTSQTINIFVRDSSSTTGGGLTGLVFNTASLVAYYALPRAAAVQITLATLAAATSAYSSGGFKEIDATNMPGWYRLDLPDAAIASGRFVSIHLKGAANMAPLPLEIELTGWNNQDAVRGGLTALPNANAAAANGLPILGTNATAISFTGGMTISSSAGTALAITSSGGNGHGVDISANGTGSGIHSVGGATGRGAHFVGGAASGAGLRLEASGGNGIGLHALGFGSGAGIMAAGGATGPGVSVAGGATSGDGVDIVTTSGDGISVLPTAGNGLVLTANGTSKHGLVSTGGTAGTSDGIKAVAGTGGVPIRGDITGNLVGTVSTLTTYTGNTPQTGDGFARIGAAGAGLTALGDTRIANLDATVSSRLAPGGTLATVTNLTNAPTSGDFTAAMKTSLNAATPSVTVSDKTGFSLSAAGIQAIWDALTSALTTVGSIGKLLVTQLDATISSRMATFSLPTNFSALGITAGGKISGVVLTDTVTTYTGNTPQTGDAFARIGAAGAGLTALGDARIANLDATISSRTKPADTQAAVTTVTNLTNAPTSGDFTAAMKTSLNAATPAASLSSSERNAIADALLVRDWTAVAAPAARSVFNALRFLRNKWSLAGTTLTVTAEDDATTAWTATVTTDASAIPVTGSDPT